MRGIWIVTIQKLIDSCLFTLVNDGGNGNTEISGVYCCDLLSHAMGSAPADCVWITVMNNINTLAVASLADCGAVVIAAGVPLDPAFVKKAEQQDITILSSDEQIFETAKRVYDFLK